MVTAGGHALASSTDEQIKGHRYRWHWEEISAGCFVDLCANAGQGWSQDFSSVQIPLARCHCNLTTCLSAFLDRNAVVVRSSSSSEKNSAFLDGRLWSGWKYSEKAWLYLCGVGKHDEQFYILKAALWKRGKCKSLIIGVPWQWNNSLAVRVCCQTANPKLAKQEKERKISSCWLTFSAVLTKYFQLFSIMSGVYWCVLIFQSGTLIRLWLFNLAPLLH